MFSSDKAIAKGRKWALSSWKHKKTHPHIHQKEYMCFHLLLLACLTDSLDAPIVPNNHNHSGLSDFSEAEREPAIWALLVTPGSMDPIKLKLFQL